MEEASGTKRDVRGNLLIIEGVFIILLVLFSGFLAYQNQQLTKELETRNQPQQTPSPTPTPTPSPSASASPTTSAKATQTPKATTAPGVLNY